MCNCNCRQLLYSHQQSLLISLKEEEDPAMVLHLTAVLLFQQHTGCIIHVPGKLIPLIINFLESRISSEEYSIVTRFQELVSLQWKASGRNKPTSEITGEISAEASHSNLHSTELSENEEAVSKDVFTPVTSADVDLQLKDLIEKLKGLVIKPRKSVVPEN